MKKIVALVELMTLEQDKMFKEFVSSKGWGYWHWIDGSWLINTHDQDNDSPTVIRDKIQEIAPGKNSMVFEIAGVKAWAGFGPNTEANDMFQWIRDEWKA